MKLKDKKIIIYEKTSTTNDNGFPIEAYMPVHPGTLWAYKRQLSAKEYYAARTVNIEEEMIFEVNWRADLTTENSLSYFIRYGDEWYNITRVDTYEGYKADLKIFASRLNYGPDASEIVPYSIDP